MRWEISENLFFGMDHEAYWEDEMGNPDKCKNKTVKRLFCNCGCVLVE